MSTPPKIPIPTTAVRDTQRPPGDPGGFQPACGEQVFYVLDRGPSLGKIRQATVIDVGKDGFPQRVELNVMTDRRTDGLMCPYHTIADWSGHHYPGTWHRA